MVLVGQPVGQALEVWDPGMYPAEILSCELTRSTYPGKEGTPRLKWVIRVHDQGAVNDVWYWTNATLTDHAAATFRPLVRAALPELALPEVKADPTFTVDTDDLVGRRIQVVLGVDEARGRNRVEKVLPATTRRARGARPAAEPGEEPTESAGF